MMSKYTIGQLMVRHSTFSRYSQSIISQSLKTYQIELFINKKIIILWSKLKVTNKNKNHPKYYSETIQKLIPRMFPNL